MGRLTRDEYDRRFNLTVRLWCDQLDGVYPWPDGKKREPGHTNKSEILRAANYSKTYKNAYKIFDRLDFKQAVEREMTLRKTLRLKTELPEGEQVDEMIKYCNLELLDRLQNRPSEIPTKDLIAARTALEKLKVGGQGAGEKKRFSLSVGQLVVSLDGLIPQSSLDAVKKTAGLPAAEVVEGELVDA